MKRILVGVAFASLLSAAALAQAPSPEGGARGPAAAAAGEGARAAGAPRAPRNPVIPAATLKLPYAPVAGPKVPGEEYGSVAGVALNSKEHLYVYQRTDNALIEFDAKGAFVRNFGPGLQTRAHSVRVDSADNIWIVDVGAHTVSKLDPSGKVLLTLGTKGTEGTWDEAKGVHAFNQPTDVGFGKNGDIFVSTGHGGTDPRIVRFDKTGKFLNTWSLAHADGSRANIHSMTVGPDGNVYAGDREIMKIKVFTPVGAPVREISVKNLVCSLMVDSKGDLWMTAGQDGMIMRMDWNGNVLGWTGKLGKGLNEYGEAHYMATTKDLKTIYVSDTVNNSVQKLVRP